MARRHLALVAAVLAAGVLVSCGRGGDGARTGGGAGRAGAPVDSAAAAAESLAAHSDSALALHPYANPLLDDVRRVLRTQNPRIALARIVALRHVVPDGTHPLLIGWGIRADRTYHGDFSDELFGVFAADDSLTRVERVFDIFPTKRWLDYEVGFLGTPDEGTIRVYGRGATYGDEPWARTYTWFQGKPPVPAGGE
ncbi:MAG TPA: hypothetical protein VF363_09670 [Candidatus Eisenbacteria bacterium]